MTDEIADDVDAPAKKIPGWLKVTGAALAVLLGFSILTGQDLIDLPEWANIPGVDLPLIGDTDQIDCRLSFADEAADPVLIQIDVVDGDSDTYVDYQYIWNNGNLVDATVFDRPADNRFVVPVVDESPEQFFSISIEPEREERVWCESIMIG